jgi:hypothetical protein
MKTNISSKMEIGLSEHERALLWSAPGGWSQHVVEHSDSMVQALWDIEELVVACLEPDQTQFLNPRSVYQILGRFMEPELAPGLELPRARYYCSCGKVHHRSFYCGECELHAYELPAGVYISNEEGRAL